MKYEPLMKIIQEKVHLQIEEEILKAVNRCEIKVDKDELIKALNYDRQQYQKGYEDGKAECPQWIPCSERLPKEDGLYLVTTKYSQIPTMLEWRVGFWFDEEANIYKVIAWMPLPEAYKGETE